MPRKGLLLVVFAAIFLGGCNLSQRPLEITPEVTTLPLENSAFLGCDELIEAAITTAGEVCDGVSINQACYGHTLVEAEFQAEATAEFTSQGDVVDLLNVRRLSAAPLDTNANPQRWGVTLLKAQANIPDTLPGQAVTFLLFGDTELTDITADVNAITLRTGIGQPTCDREPPPAMLVQSPEGIQITMNINGADVTLGSTLYFTATENGELTVATIEGVGVVSAFNTSRIIQPGAQVRLPLGTDDRLTVTGTPSPPEPFNQAAVRLAPLSLLERPVQIPQPIGPIGPTIPTSTSPPNQSSAPAGACVPRSDWTQTYTVRRGDTLFVIARQVGVSVDELQQGNCIVNASRISAGQVLRVPTAPSGAPNQPPQSSAVCGDNVCQANENANSCATDCGIRITPTLSCGNAVCETNENANSCPADCNQSAPPITTSEVEVLCGNKICDVGMGENARVCPTDCDLFCGDDLCVGNENSQTCAADCATVCGNLVCDIGEDARSCPADCGS